MPNSCLLSPAGSCLPLPAGGRKVATPPPPPLHKRRRHRRRSRKQPDQNLAAAAVSGFLSAAGLAGFELAAAADSLSVADLVVASAPSENLMRNCIEFRNLG